MSGTGTAPLRTPTPIQASQSEDDLLQQSLDRARKRHLSPKTFRGDQAVDRLLAQELAASPLLKKSRLKPGSTLPVPGVTNKMALSKEEFYEYMETKNAKRFDLVEKSISNLDGKIQTNATKIDAQSLLISANQGNIAVLREEMGRLKNPRPPGEPKSYANAAATPSSPTMSPGDDLDYLRARRSVRLWHIPGSTRPEIWRSAWSFIQVKLSLTTIGEDRIESISRPEIPSGRAVVDEATVTFKEIGVRYSAVGASSKLSQFVDTNGRPTAGIRMEVPRKLRTAFTSLFRFGQQLRGRHGEGTRKHVKFNDATKSLYLKIKLPGDEEWSRVSLELARRGIRARQQLTDSKLERRLDPAGQMSTRPRAASVTGTSAMDTSAPPTAP